jgi:hypothetical protein
MRSPNEWQVISTRKITVKFASYSPANGNGCVPTAATSDSVYSACSDSPMLCCGMDAINLGRLEYLDMPARYGTSDAPDASDSLCPLSVFYPGLFSQMHRPPIHRPDRRSD